MSDHGDGHQLHLVLGDAPADLGSPDPRAVADFFDPSRLTQARHLAGLTKKAVADEIGVSAAAVGQYETGLSRPRPETLTRLAKVLGVPVGFFLAGRPHGRIAASSPHFRSLRSMRVGERDKAIATVEQAWELAHELERHVELPALRLPDYAPDVADDDPCPGDVTSAGTVVIAADG